jgi:hypothetical protein
MKLKIVSFITMAFMMTIVVNSAAQSTYSNVPSENRLHQATVFTGRLTGWSNNRDFAYDGFYLQSGTENYLVKFSPNLGNELTSALKVGSEISVNAVEVPEITDKKVIRLVNITTNGMNIYDNPPALKVLAPAEEFIYGSGKITQIQDDKAGELKGYILNDKTVLRIPIYAAEQLDKIAVAGAYVTYSGSQILRNGEFAPVHYTIVRCRTLTIDEKQYIID